MKSWENFYPQLLDVKTAAERISPAAVHTPLIYNENLSEFYQSNICFKREDLQPVRSYKIRGAYNKIACLQKEGQVESVVCASAGNHAQGVALSCSRLKVKGYIFMPVTTPRQKLHQVERFGGAFVEIRLTGDTFDDSFDAAWQFSEEHAYPFVHPFDDEKIIEGQATVGLELFEQSREQVDYVFLPIGGGGLAAGIASVAHVISPATKIIGVEPSGAASMRAAMNVGKATKLLSIDKFVDGASVKKVGELNFKICNELLTDCCSVSEGKVCQTIIELYNREGLVVEPAGALSVAALDQYKSELKGKNVVCVISGGNNDMTRTEEIKERALIYQGLKHYFIVNFPQRPGALKDFLTMVLEGDDDITFFEYAKKHSRENGSATVGIQLKRSTDFQRLSDKMKANGFYNEYLNDKPHLMDVLI